MLPSRRTRPRRRRIDPEPPPMSQTGLPHDVVEYPCSDGQPMAETDIHGACMMYVTCALRGWFKRRGRTDVYVASNNFLYYEQGNPRAVVSPDVYVVVGVPAHLRDTYLLWNEPKGPDFVLEVTSASTRRVDERRKRDVYAAGGGGEGGVPDAAATSCTTRGRSGERGAGAGASRRARGADGAVARPGDRAGPPHLRGIRACTRRGSRRASGAMARIGHCRR